MPNDGNDKGSKEARTRRNWWYKAKRFIIRDTGMYDMGDNAQLNINENHINAGVVFITERLAPDTSFSDWHGSGGAREPDQQRIPTAQISSADRSRDDVPQIMSVRGSPTPETNTVLSNLPSNLSNSFTSEAVAEYADPDVPLDIPLSYSYTSRARAHIYSLGMLTHRAGYPLYTPTPVWGLPTTYRKRGIRIGDVGTLTADGAFDFLFNICQPDTGNPAELPDNFELLEPSIRSYRKFAPSACLTSDHVDHLMEAGDQNWSPEFQCSAAEGAVLVLPQGATLYQAMNRLHFQNHASRHAISWYRYMLNNGRDSANGSLYLVTECIKSMNWGISVFYSLPTTNSSLRFIFNEGQCLWYSRGKIEARAGPERGDITISEEEEPNQCVFVRGYKIMLRSDIWDKMRNAVDVTSQDGEFSSPPSTRATSHSPSYKASGNKLDSSNRGKSSKSNVPSHSRLELPGGSSRVAKTARDGSCFGQVILEENFEESPLHPSDPINFMLLHVKPEASVSLVHDSAWCKHLPYGFITDPVNPDVDGLLENIQWLGKVDIDDYGSVVLDNSAEMEEMESKIPDDVDISSSPLFNATSFPAADYTSTFPMAYSPENLPLEEPQRPKEEKRTTFMQGVSAMLGIRKELGKEKDQGKQQEDVLPPNISRGKGKERDVEVMEENRTQRKELKMESHKWNEVTDRVKHNRTSPLLQPPSELLATLLSALKKKPTSSIKSVVNRDTVELARRLFIEDYFNTSGQLMDDSDVKILLDFLLYLLRNGRLINSETGSNPNQRARQFMFQLIAETPVIPASLFVTGISMQVRREIIGGEFGAIFKGKLGRKPVALKVFHKTHNNVAFCRKALMWRSLNHKFVLPFLGIYEPASVSHLFLVSPYMEKGTLSQWRKKVNRSTDEIEKLIFEVAQGMEYIHSEGVVHGDLRGDNVLLDANLHVQIADFGLTRSSESTADQSGALYHKFVDPGTSGALTKGRFPIYDGAPPRTKDSDVYAFGCLYYEIQYDVIPFAKSIEVHGKKRAFLGSIGELPPRHDEPPLSDEAWELIQWCWDTEAIRRPEMNHVQETMTAWQMHQSEPSKRGSTILQKLPPAKSNVTNIRRKINTWFRSKYPNPPVDSTSLGQDPGHSAGSEWPDNFPSYPPSIRSSSEPALYGPKSINTVYEDVDHFSDSREPKMASARSFSGPDLYSHPRLQDDYSGLPEV